MSADEFPRCTGCGRKMRPARVTAAEAPGTVASVGSGRCATCYRHQTGRTRPVRARVVHMQPVPQMPDDMVAAVRALVARRGCPDVLDILGIAS